MNLINWIPNDYCTKCNKSSLYLITTKGKAVRMSDYDENINYSHIHCMNCKEDYAIDWRRHEPRILRDSYGLDIFLHKWKH